MPHTIEPAGSGRAACRGCGAKIAKGELRFGERIPNPYADDTEMTLWFHLDCGAFKRPETFLEALGECRDVLASAEDRERLEADARYSLEHRRLPRFDGAERSPTGRASCRSCRAKIAKDSWRIRLVYFEEERFTPSGFLHAGCAVEYLGTAEFRQRLARFGPALSAEEQAEFTAALHLPPATPEA